MSNNRERWLYLQLYESKNVITSQGNGVLINCDEEWSSVEIKNKILSIRTDDIIPVAKSLKEMSAHEYNHVGKLLSNGEFTRFTREFIKTTGREDVMAFESSTNNGVFGYEINITDGSINSAYQIKNVFEAYLYLVNNDFEVSQIGKKTGYGYAKWR